MRTVLRITLPRIILIVLATVIIGYLNKWVLNNNIFFLVIAYLLMGKICYAIDQKILKFK